MREPFIVWGGEYVQHSVRHHLCANGMQAYVKTAVTHVDHA